MVIGVTVIAVSLLYSILLAIVYFSKKRITSFENQIYSKLVIINIFGLILELLCSYLVYKYGANPLYDILCVICNRLFIVYLLSWEFLFTLYTFYISFNHKNSRINKKQILTITAVFYLILLPLAILLPLDYVYDGTYVYSYGPATNLLVIMGGIFILFDIFCVSKNFKNIKTKKYFPVYLLIILLTGAIVIRIINPGIVLINSTFAFVTFLMYFTIENPDMQMMEELYKNKKLIEKSNQDTSNFLFRMTQDIKSPVKDIINISRDMTTMSNIEALKENAKGINNLSNEIDYLINDALDVTSMNTKQIKVYDSRYNVINLFKELEYRFENELNGIKFNFEMSKVIPTYLYGDSIKLKQAIKSILNNALVHTKEGEITMTVSGLVKYGICRLMVSVTDTGGGISIEEVNNILSMSGDELSQIKLDNDNEKLTLKEVKKLLTLLGGNLMVKSEEDKGTTVSVVLDQKIVELKETEITKKLESYEQTLYRNKKVMVVDDDAKELAQITTWLENHDAEVNGSLFGRDCIEKISSHMKYDLILLDDETSTYSALEVLKELKQTKKFNIPVVVMINDNKEFIKLHYLQDGFADVIMKSKLESEINRIMKRF